MSTEGGDVGGDAGSACGEANGDATISRRHTWDEGEQHSSQGRPHPEDEAEPGDDGEEGCREGRSCRDTCGGDDGGNFCGEDGAVGGSSCKAPAMHSNCSSETCIPTPSCRICFQGAEQVRDLVNTPSDYKVKDQKVRARSSQYCTRIG